MQSTGRLRTERTQSVNNVNFCYGVDYTYCKVLVVRRPVKAMFYGGKRSSFCDLLDGPIFVGAEGVRPQICFTTRMD
jgi:hypothetical protein